MDGFLYNIFQFIEILPTNSYNGCANTIFMRGVLFMIALPYTPTVENRYNLTYSAVKNLKVGNRELIKSPLFFWNSAICAWCICDASDKQWRENSFWIGIHTLESPVHPGEFRFYFSNYTGMCSYTFEKFYNPDEIKSKYDLIIQEKFLATINKLLDMGILVQA